VESAREKRKELEGFLVLDVHDAEHKARLLQEADEAMERVKLGCDLLVGVRLLGLTQSEQEQMLSHLLWDYVAGQPMESIDAQNAIQAARKEHAFHWPFEFPEVFENSGFNSFIGNPPFLGGKRISTEFGMNYQRYLKNFNSKEKGSADLCAYFFLRSYSLLIGNGTTGLIATNTIAQGDTRTIGLDYLTVSGATIFRTNPNMSWPGVAAVYISIVWIYKGKWKGEIWIESKRVSIISSFLTEMNNEIGDPQRLKENNNIAFQGTIVNGEGFILQNDEAQQLMSENGKNKEVIMPFLNGKDLNTQPDQLPTRWIINFRDWSFEKAKEYPDCLRILTERVKPGRDIIINRGKQIHEFDYWKFWDKRLDNYAKLLDFSEVLVCPLVSKYVNFAFVPSQMVFMHKIGVFYSDKYSDFCLLQSSIHQLWAWQYSSTLGLSGINYSLSDVVETFPFPRSSNKLEDKGRLFYDYRKQIMLSCQEGLTTTYNNFHNPQKVSSEITHLREFHLEMDKAIAECYGWSDINLDHGFHETPQGLRFTISESAQREVLDRLLKLNLERYEEEVRQGLHDKKGKKKENAAEKQKPKKLAQAKAQMFLIDSVEQPEENQEDIIEKREATPINEIGAWDQCVCLACGKYLAGFTIGEHTKKVHGGKDPGYRKVNS